MMNVKLVCFFWGKGKVPDWVQLGFFVANRVCGEIHSEILYRC